MLNVFDRQNRDMLEGIQGNILKAHGRHHTANVFISCNDGEQTRAKLWLKSLVQGDEAIIRSGYKQLRSNILFKESDGEIDTGLFACIHISSSGYDYLFGENTSLLFEDSSFQHGMKNADLHAGPNDPKLNDPSPIDWETGLNEDNHFMLLLAHANGDELTSAVEAITELILSFARITTVEKGKAIFNKDKAGLEHFGYVDGISQPLFFDDEWQIYKADNSIQNEADITFDPRAEKELVLVPDPFFPDEPDVLGSYFVFRKLEQNVKGFKQAELEVAGDLGLVGEDVERAGAMIVGRFEDGSPVQLSDEAGLIHSYVLNNFDYDGLDGAKCPFHGHIRKTNPRSATPGGIQEAQKHIMARRGIPYGSRTDDPNDGQIDNKPENGVGLLFMSYQSSIINQFEFIQKNWANNPSFPHIKSKNTDGLDPVIGQGIPRVAGVYASEWGNVLTQKRVSFEQFVHMKGGEYFFAPSMSFLKTIDTILL